MALEWYREMSEAVCSSSNQQESKSKVAAEG